MYIVLTHTHAHVHTRSYRKESKPMSGFKKRPITGRYHKKAEIGSSLHFIETSVFTEFRLISFERQNRTIFSIGWSIDQISAEGTFNSDFAGEITDKVTEMFVKT